MSVRCTPTAILKAFKSYTPIIGQENRDLEVSYSDNRNAGTATGSVTVGSATAKATFRIEPAIPDIGAVSVNETVTDKTSPADILLSRANTSLDGTLQLTDTALYADQTAYHWQFTPADPANYETITGTVTINVRDATAPEAEIDSSKYTVANDGTITLQTSYLQTLAAGEYVLTVSYHPLASSRCGNAGRSNRRHARDNDPCADGEKGNRSCYDHK